MINNALKDIKCNKIVINFFCNFVKIRFIFNNLNKVNLIMIYFIIVKLNIYFQLIYNLNDFNL